MKCSPLFSADAYSISSNAFASNECKDFSCYNLTARKSPAESFPELAKDSRMIFYGINQAVNSIFRKITQEDLDSFCEFMKRAHSFGGALPFDKDMWQWIIDYNNGYLPIQISAIPEGTTFFPNEPIVHVYNTERGFGELAAHIEARLVGTVAIGTACATLCRHWLDRICNEVEKDNQILGYPTDKKTLYQNAQFQIHNFGSRACSSEEESILTGLSHLLSFNGTDNFDAAYNCWLMGGKEPKGTSIVALAHRNVSGHDMEVGAFHSISNATEGDKVRIASFVADCYNYNNAVDSLTEIACHNPDVIHVIRPDSGDCFDTLYKIYETCINRKLYKEVNGYKLPTNVRFIYGDSVKPKKQFEVMQQLREKGMLPTQWGIWGVGGYIRNTPNRDSLSFAHKLCVKGQDYTPVVKLSETRGKLSIPYKTHLVRDFPEPVTVHRENDCVILSPTGRLVRVNYYDKDNLGYESFDKVQNRAIDSFDNVYNWAKQHPTFGMNRENLHPNIRQLQDEFYERFQ